MRNLPHLTEFQRELAAVKAATTTTEFDRLPMHSPAPSSHSPSQGNNSTEQYPEEVRVIDEMLGVDGGQEMLGVEGGQGMLSWSNPLQIRLPDGMQVHGASPNGGNGDVSSPASTRGMNAPPQSKGAPDASGVDDMPIAAEAAAVTTPVPPTAPREAPFNDDDAAAEESELRQAFAVASPRNIAAMPVPYSPVNLLHMNAEQTREYMLAHAVAPPDTTEPHACDGGSMGLRWVTPPAAVVELNRVGLAADHSSPPPSPRDHVIKL